MKSFMFKYKYRLAIILSAIILITLSIILYFNIPRLSYKYSDYYEGYIVDKAYGNSDTYIIDDYVNGKPVVGVGTRAFFRHSNLKEIIFKNEGNIKIIEKLAFAECSKLNSISLTYVTEIERNAFMYDKALEEINISSKYIGASAFYKCSSLSNVILNDGVLKIGSMAFSETNIKTITIPSTVLDIAIDAFLFCDSLEQIIVKSKHLINNDYLNSLDNVIFEVE